jgi:DHA1 family tetracycline resistance protein-like MFS transporter
VVRGWGQQAGRAGGDRGVRGGSIGVAYAFAADLALPGQRTRVLGAVGAAVGLGFTAGPALGALLSGAGMAGAGAG